MKEIVTVTSIRLGPYFVGIAAPNGSWVAFPPEAEDWELIIKMIRELILSKETEIWTDGTWIP